MHKNFVVRKMADSMKMNITDSMLCDKYEQEKEHITYANEDIIMMIVVLNYI